MGNSAFYWWPEEDGPMSTIDLGERISDLDDPELRSVQLADVADLEPSGVDYGGRQSVRIVLERFQSADLYHKLRSLENHLQRGLPVGFAVDTAKAWAGYLQGFGVAARETSLLTTGNNFNYASVVTIAADEWVEISTSNPERKVSRHKVDSYTSASGLLTLDSATKTAWSSSGYVIQIRHVWFWPILYLAPGQYSRKIVSTDHGINYTLDVELVTAPAIVDLLHSPDGDLGINFSTTDISGGALQQIIDSRRLSAASNISQTASGLYVPPGGVYTGSG